MIIAGVRSDGPRERGRGRLTVRWIVAAATIAAAGHVGVQYLPRERPSQPRPGSAAAELLAAPGYTAALWVPYPHQNLAVLGSREWRQAMAGAAALLELPVPEVPSFGPFPVPPARELAVAVDRDAGRGAVVADVYPLIARVARGAGRLTGNHWLAGGTATAGGRAVDVGWRGDTWSVISGQPPAAAAGTSGEEAVLAWLRLGAAVDPFPPGLYRLRRLAGGELELASVAPRPAPAAPSPLRDGVALVVLQGPRSPAAPLGPVEPSGRRARAWAVFADRDAAAGALPAFAVLAPGEPPEDALPARSLLSVLGARPATASGDGWGIAALDPSAARRAQALTSALAAWLPAGDRPAASFGLWLDIEACRPLVRDLVELLEAVSPLGDRYLARARAVEGLLAALSGYRRAELVVAADGASALVRVL